MSITPEELEKTDVDPEPVVEKTDVEPEAVEDTPMQRDAEELVVEDLLVEDVSIDGMCGVY